MLEFIKNIFKGIFDPPLAPGKALETPKKETDNDKFDLEVFSMTDDVKVYALSTCIHCRNAKKYLDECGVKYQCVHVDELKGDERKKIVQEIKDKNPAVSFPTIVIKDTVIVGFHKDQIDTALKEE